MIEITEKLLNRQTQSNYLRFIFFILLKQGMMVRVTNLIWSS